MSITVVGEGIVGRRITRLLTDHDHRVVAPGPRDSAIDPSTWPVSNGDIVVLAIPGEHAPPAAQLAELGAVGRVGR